MLTSTNFRAEDYSKQQLQLCPIIGFALLFHIGEVSSVAFYCSLYIHTSIDMKKIKNVDLTIKC